MNHLECATSKNNNWYWYILVLLLSFLAFYTIGVISQYIIVAIFFVISEGDISSLSKMDLTGIDDRNLVLFSTLFMSVCLLAAMIFFIKIFHNKTWTQVINGTNRVRWSRFFFGIAIWGVISLISFAISFFTDPESLTFRFDAGRFIVLVLISVVFIPIQTTSEEFVFRGYLTQGIASWTKSRWWTLLIPSVLFGLMHGANPEIQEYGFWLMMPQYIFMGLMFGLITILDDGIELAMGMHAINNFFGCALSTYEGSALQTDALFIANEVNPGEDIIWLVVAGIIAITIFAFRYKWNFKILGQKISKKVAS